jgi:hypothetical protein
VPQLKSTLPIVNSSGGESRHANEICAPIKQRISIPWLWRYHNLPGEPKPGGRCRSPFYQDNKPDFFISRNGQRFKDHGEPEHKGDVINFEMFASRCERGEAIRRLRVLASLSENGISRALAVVRPQAREYRQSEQLRPMMLDFLERGSADDLKRLAELRCVARDALETARDAGTLQFATLRGLRAWIVTDCAHYVAEARRLDGKLWQHITVGKLGRCRAEAKAGKNGRLESLKRKITARSRSLRAAPILSPLTIGFGPRTDQM